MPHAHVDGLPLSAPGERRCLSKNAGASSRRRQGWGLTPWPSRYGPRMAPTCCRPMRRPSSVKPSRPDARRHQRHQRHDEPDRGRGLPLRSSGGGAWAASSWLPPRLAARFSPAEQAVLGVVLSTIALTGRCEWCHGAVAGRSGTSVSTVKRALAQARVLGLVIVEERRLSWARSLPSVVTIASAELRTWVATRGRGLRAARGMWGDGGGVQTGAASKSISKLSLSNAAPTSPERVWRGRGGQAGGSPPARPPAPGSTPGPLRSPYSGTRARRV